MSILQVSSSRIGREPDCKVCGAGSTLSFNWEYAKTIARSEAKRDLSIFVTPVQLRWGQIFHCASCAQPWYLDGKSEFMNVVPLERLDLIQKWNEHEILLKPEHLQELQDIGRTPPDLYGNGAQFHETPCSVLTKSGERIDLAMVSMQRHAPFEEWRHYRLGSEIEAIFPSTYALPFSVRVATSQADEISNGFAPTRIEFPNGEVTDLNWTQSFFVQKGCDARKIKLTTKHLGSNKLPTPHAAQPSVTYFVVDALH